MLVHKHHRLPTCAHDCQPCFPLQWYSLPARAKPRCTLLITPSNTLFGPTMERLHHLLSTFLLLRFSSFWPLQCQSAAPAHASLRSSAGLHVAARVPTDGTAVVLFKPQKSVHKGKAFSNFHIIDFSLIFLITFPNRWLCQLYARPLSCIQLGWS